MVFLLSLNSRNSSLKQLRGYLASCSTFFGRQIKGVDEAVDALQKLLQEKSELLSLALETAYKKVSLESRLESVRKAYGSIKACESIRRKEFNEAKERGTIVRKLFSNWLEHLEAEPTIFSLLGFVSAIKRRIENRHQLFLTKHLPELKIGA